VFYLHHAQIDRLWWQWQRRDPRRLFEIGGVKRDFRWFGKTQSESTTMNDVLTIVGAGENVHSQIKDIMDTEDGILCYRY
jgi:tyrosinase